jgi:acetyl esterase/lipase
VALRDGSSPVAAVMSISGAFDATLTSPSIDAGFDPQLDRVVLEDWRSTISAVADPADPLTSPLFADLHALPPMLLLAGDHDVWRDDSVRLAANVTAVGGAADLEVVDEMWHCWPVWGEFPEAAKALARCRGFLDRHARGR